MKKSHLFLLLLLFISGCADPKISDVFKPYVNEFEFNHGWPIHNIEFRFGSIREPRTAQCKNFSDNVNLILNDVITIDKEKWESACDEQRRAIIFHELGHCVLDRDHTKSDVISYMRSSLGECEWYEENKEELFDELFN